MIRALALSAALFPLALPGVAHAEVQTTVIRVERWSCCGSGKTEAAVKALPGVSFTRANKAEKLLIVSFDDAKTSEAAIRDAVRRTGARCEPKEKDGSA